MKWAPPNKSHIISQVFPMKVRSFHGMSNSPEYRAYHAMRTRCYIPTCKLYKNYGARGIQVKWATFEQFLADVGKRPSPRHSIERIDNNGHYEPGNCRWATDKEQNRNTRANHFVSYRGERITLAELSERVGVVYNTLSNRARKGWSGERLIQPPKKRKHHVQSS